RERGSPGRLRQRQRGSRERGRDCCCDEKLLHRASFRGWEKCFRCLFISASNLPGCLMPGRIGLSPETPSPYLPDPDQRLPGFARAALLKNVNNYRGCDPGNPRKDRPKRDFFQLPYYVGPLWAERGAVMMD